MVIFHSYVTVYQRVKHMDWFNPYHQTSRSSHRRIGRRLRPGERGLWQQRQRSSCLGGPGKSQRQRQRTKGRILGGCHNLKCRFFLESWESVGSDLNEMMKWNSWHFSFCVDSPWFSHESMSQIIRLRIFWVLRRLTWWDSVVQYFLCRFQSSKTARASGRVEATAVGVDDSAAFRNIRRTCT